MIKTQLSLASLQGCPKQVKNKIIESLIKHYINKIEKDIQQLKWLGSLLTKR